MVITLLLLLLAAPSLIDSTNLTNEAVTLPPPDDDLHIYALPVGQGDSTVIQCPRADDGEISIIDMGSSKSTGVSEDDLVRYLNGQRIKYMILTHPDTDHIKYVDSVLDSYNKSVPVYHSCPWKKYKVYSPNAVPNRVTKCCGKEGCDLVLTLCPTSGATLEVVGSEYYNCRRGGSNRDSIVSVIQYEGVRALVMGDFEGSKRFIKRYIKCAGGGADIRADIYRLSHHGAYNGKANTTPLLKAVNATHVFSSSGLKSNYKHPRCELYNYYHNKVYNEDTVHPYTCYQSTGKPVTHYTTDSIYVTTVINNSGIINNYIVYFNIDNNGNIQSGLTLFN